METGLSSLKSGKGLGLPVPYFLVILLICIAPTTLSIFDVNTIYNNPDISGYSDGNLQNPGQIAFGKFLNAILVAFSISICLFTCVFAAIEFKIKKELVSSVIFTVMLCLAILDIVYLLISTEVIATAIPYEESLYFSWFIGRILSTIFLIFGTGYFLFKKEVYKTAKNHLTLINCLFIALTILGTFISLYVKKIPGFLIQQNAFFTHPAEFFIIILFLVWGALIVRWVNNEYPGIFSKLLIISVLPAIFASLHLSLYTQPFDFDFNFARFLKLIAYLVPLIGISLNYSRNTAKQYRLNVKLDREIKEKEKIQKDLESRQNMLRHAESIADMGSWEINGEKENIVWSDALYTLLGLTEKTLQPSIKTMLGLVEDASKREELSKAIASSLEEQESFDLECQILRADGKKRDIRWQGKYVIENKKLIGTCIDVTAIKEAKEKLERNEKILKQAESISHVGSFEWNEMLGISFISDELYRIHGFRPNSKIADIGFYATLIHPDDAERCKAAVNKALKLKKSFIIEYRIIRPDNEIRYLYANAKIIEGISGNYSEIRGTIQDITELKNAAILIEKTESIYKTIAKNVPDSVVMIFNKEYDLLLQEGQISDHLSFKTQPEIGLNINELLFEKDLGFITENLNKAFNDQQISLEHTKDSKYYKTDFIPVKNTSGEIFNVMVVTQDISGIKAVQMDLEDKIQELNRSNHDLEQFVYIASHDLQEPLRKIYAFGDLLQLNYTDSLPEEGQDYINRMQNASQRMQVLINDLLTFSKATRGDDDFEETNLYTELLKVLEQLEFTIEKKQATIDIIVNHEIKAIPVLIRQLFQNILSNSLKFSKKDVPPVIEIKSEILNGQQITEFDSDPSKNYCVVSIKDNGIGFDEQYADKIFAPFQRLHTRNEYEGTGIGLAICKKIIDRHNGNIYVQSKPGEGSIFKLFFLAG